MIGIFDSGVGGFNALYEVRKMLPSADILYLADRDNAPYGTKDEDELIRLVKNDIKRLSERGARAILIACCTASTVYSRLSEYEKRISIPIIAPAARQAAIGKRITVIATNATVRSHSFKNEICKFSDTAKVTEIPASELVTVVEGGARCGNMTYKDRDIFDRICKEIKNSTPDTLVLGCTHFSHLHGEFCTALPSVKIVSPAIEGADELIKHCKNENLLTPHGRGVTVYL